MAKETNNEVAGVNLPANVCFTHDGSNTMYIGNFLSKSDGKPESEGGTAIVGVITRMELLPSGCVMIYVGDSHAKPGRLLLTPSGMLLIMKG